MDRHSLDVRPFPGDDADFARAVDKSARLLVGPSGAPRPGLQEALESLLRDRYPHVHVRFRDALVSFVGEPLVLYVFRDGVMRARHDGRAGDATVSRVENLMSQCAETAVRSRALVWEAGTLLAMMRRSRGAPVLRVVAPERDDVATRMEWLANSPARASGHLRAAVQRIDNVLRLNRMLAENPEFRSWAEERIARAEQELIALEAALASLQAVA